MEGTKLANPGPLGLAGFGMTTILLSIHNTGCFPMASAIMAMAVFYGGIAQIMAGIMEFKKGNTFGMTAFISYGSFWLTLVFILIFKGLPESTPAFLGWYLFVWGLFTFFMWFATFGSNRVLQFVFLSLFVVYWLLAIGDWAGSPATSHAGGWLGILCGLAAFYLSMAEVINENAGRKVLPIGALKA